jgi:hypothetical protein
LFSLIPFFIECKLLNLTTSSPPEGESELFNPSRRATANQKRKVLVYFLGGITFAEISAIRFLNTQFTDKLFVIATTSIISAGKCLDQLTPVLENGLNKENVLSEKKK